MPDFGLDLELGLGSVLVPAAGPLGGTLIFTFLSRGRRGVRTEIRDGGGGGSDRNSRVGVASTSVLMFLLSSCVASTPGIAALMIGPRGFPGLACDPHTSGKASID